MSLSNRSRYHLNVCVSSYCAGSHDLTSFELLNSDRLVPAHMMGIRNVMIIKTLRLFAQRMLVSWN